jgi:hypothetical protein
MDATASSARTADGRFAAGHSGNPNGRPKGRQSLRAILEEGLREGEAAALVRGIIDDALKGNGVAARFVIAHVATKPKGRALALDLPVGATLIDAYQAALAGIVAGEITPGEGIEFARFLTLGDAVAVNRFDYNVAVQECDRAARAAEIEEEEFYDDEAEFSSPSPLVGEGRGGGSRENDDPSVEIASAAAATEPDPTTSSRPGDVVVCPTPPTPTLPHEAGGRDDAPVFALLSGVAPIDAATGGDETTEPDSGDVVACPAPPTPTLPHEGGGSGVSPVSGLLSGAPEVAPPAPRPPHRNGLIRGYFAAGTRIR